MLTLSLPLEADINKAIARAILRVLTEKPQIEFIGEGTFKVSAKSQTEPYQVTLTLNSNQSQISATCNCRAHSGEDTIIDRNGQPFTLIPKDYQPQLCKHIMAVLLSITFKGEVKLAKAECYRCGNPKAHFSYISRLYECLDCMQEDLFGKDDGSTVPLCEACRENPASVEGALCRSCFDLMQYSDLPGASKYS